MGEKRRLISGIGICEGVGEGTAFVVRQYKPVFQTKSALTPDEETLRIRAALKKFYAELDGMIQKAKEYSAGEEADIFEAQLILSQDSSLSQKAKNYIRQGYTSEYSIDRVCTECIDSFMRSGDRSLIDRTEDIRDIEQRIMIILSDKKQQEIKELPENSILICDEVGSNLLPLLYSKNIAGVVSQRGSLTGHAAIVVRGITIPAVFSATGVLRYVNDGQKIIVDGKNGKVYINPTSEDIDHCRKLSVTISENNKRYEKYRKLPGVTSDGFPFAVLSNIGSDEGLARANENGCEGVGLFRTEYLYQKKGTEPSEEEQFENYRKAAVMMENKDTVIRTIDIGGDKFMPYLLHASSGRGTHEKNPFLGLRGIRRSLAYRDAFIRQIKAILRAAFYGNVSINLPMLTTLEELREAKEVIAEAERILEEEGKEYKKNVPVGIMLETPSAAVLADEFAKEVDFFSVGTNDLTQYIMCAERDNPSVEYLYSIMEPAVVRAIYHIVKTAKNAGIRVGICGEASLNRHFLAMLIAWGADGVSVSPSFVTEVRASIAEIDRKKAQEFYKPVLSMGTRKEIEGYLAKSEALVK